MKNNNPVVSIVASGIRTENWLRFYNQINDTNKVKFEIVFTGHVKPDFKLPKNFVHLHTEDFRAGKGISPAACVELSMREAKGKYIIWTADDYWIPPGMIDKQLKEIQKKEHIGKRLMVGVGYCKVPENTSSISKKEFDEMKSNDKILKFHIKGDSPRMPVCPMILKKNIEEIGSIDTVFTSVYYDLDIVMRHYSLGGELIQLKDTTIAEPSENRYSKKGVVRLMKTYGKSDRSKLNELWKGRAQVEKRSREVLPYSDDYFEGKYTKYCGENN